MNPTQLFGKTLRTQTDIDLSKLLPHTGPCFLCHNVTTPFGLFVTSYFAFDRFLTSYVTSVSVTSTLRPNHFSFSPYRCFEFWLFDDAFSKTQVLYSGVQGWQWWIRKDMVRWNGGLLSSDTESCIEDGNEWDDTEASCGDRKGQLRDWEAGVPIIRRSRRFLRLLLLLLFLLLTF
jgi:hypothetical protein